jgi:hypothetical protein
MALERKRLFDPGDFVVTFAGEPGLVLSLERYAKARLQLKEGGRAGRFFAPGCCHHPDYVIQVPVFFEDGTYDVMRAMNIRKREGIPDAAREALEEAFMKGLRERSAVVPT